MNDVALLTMLLALAVSLPARAAEDRAPPKEYPPLSAVEPGEIDADGRVLLWQHTFVVAPSTAIFAVATIAALSFALGVVSTLLLVRRRRSDRSAAVPPAP